MSGSGDIHVPVEPLRTWLGERLEREGVFDRKSWRVLLEPRQGCPAGSFTRLAHLWDVDPRRLREILYYAEHVSLDSLDVVLTGAGEPYMMYMLYPQLEPDGIPA